MVAFEAIVSIAVIVLYIAYALPIFFRVTLAQKQFVPSPFNLGRYGVVVGRSLSFTGLLDTSLYWPVCGFCWANFF